MLMTIIGLLSSCQAGLVTRGDGDTMLTPAITTFTIDTKLVIIPAAMAMGASNTSTQLPSQSLQP